MAFTTTRAAAPPPPAHTAMRGAPPILQADHPDLKANIHPATMALYKAGKLTDACGGGTHAAGALRANHLTRWRLRLMLPSMLIEPTDAARAGTIGAVGFNGHGVIGVAPEVQIMACKALDNECGGSAEDVITCIEYCT